MLIVERVTGQSLPGPCTPQSGDSCGWAFVGGKGGTILCGGGQGVPVQSSGPANCAASCDGYPNVCIGQLSLSDCKAKCAADAACHGVTWNSGTRDCMPKTSATACHDFATAPKGCAIPPGSATAPISNWQFHVRCGCGLVPEQVPPSHGELDCAGEFGGWAFVIVFAVALTGCARASPEPACFCRVLSRSSS
eukprot:SAG11_NODE_1420_length_4956_cov_5.104797_4_plen_193_part_00